MSFLWLLHLNCKFATYTLSAQVYVNHALKKPEFQIINNTLTPSPTLPRCGLGPARAGEFEQALNPDSTGDRL